MSSRGRSLVERLGLAVLMVCLASAVFGAGSASALVLGSKNYMPHGNGWGTAKPNAIFNGGAPSGAVANIRWRHWGERVATGRGRIAIYKPGGGYYSRRVTIKLRAYAIGPCQGHRAYTRLSFSVPSRPGGPFGPWQPWSGSSTLCGPGRVAARVPARDQLVLYRAMAGVRLGDDLARLHRVLGAPKAVKHEANEITGSMRTDVYGKLAFSSVGGSILNMKTARRSIRTSSGIGVGTTRRRLKQEFRGLSCYRFICSIVAGGGVATIGKRVTTFWMGRGVVRMVSIGRVID